MMHSPACYIHLYIILCSPVVTHAVGIKCVQGDYVRTHNAENIALSKPTHQSSEYTDPHNSSLAVDGKTETDFDHHTCTHTSESNDQNPSWTVKLDPEIQYNVTNITLYLRNILMKMTDQSEKGQMKPYMSTDISMGHGKKIIRLDIDVQFSVETNHPPDLNPIHLSGCDQQLRGKKFTILVDDNPLTLCEVQLWACLDNYFGRHCEEECNCLNTSEVCDKTTGYCRSGCDRGWYGDGCLTVCFDGSFKSDCSNTCNCLNKSEVCNRQLATVGVDVTEGECADGTFGDCIETCNCQNTTEICNKTTGMCPHSGCKHGTYEPDCQTECDNTTYGEDCKLSCGHCLNDVPCDSENGDCPDGCQDGYSSPLCKKCDNGRYGEDCKSTCGNCFNDDPCDSENGDCPDGCQDGYSPPLCKEEIVKDNPDDEPPSHLGAIVGGVAAVLVLVAAVIGALFFLRRKQGTQKDSLVNHVPHHNSNVETAAGNIEEANDKDPPQTDSSNDNPYEIVDQYYNTIPANIALDSLKQHVRSKTVEDGFEAEFKLIRYGLNGDHEVGKTPENKKRNRFLNLFPYDHSRVTLSPDGASTWDYINASFVSGYSDKTIFIAAQGPNPVTIDDFWRMIWQQNVRKIVMLTRLVEMRKKKCEQYWPECNEKKQCENITIETTLSTVRADFTIRKFNVKHNTDCQARTITQFHFTTWPDHDVAVAPALVGFWKQVKLVDTDEQEGPPVIHCSAGIGRTGTFIALDSLMTQAEIENCVNIFMCVSKMREARMNMVQTADQYQFVYEALLEALESRGSLYTISDFDKKYGTGVTYTTAQEGELRRQFQSLQSLKIELHKTQVSDSLLRENANKNRSKDILPRRRSRPFLTTSVIGCNDYINAVILPSATRSQFFIVTQTPLPETAVDFWRLVYDHDCHTIVCLDDSQDALSLYPSERTSSTVGPFTVETVAEDTTRDSYVLLKMALSHKDMTEARRDLLVYRMVTLDTTSGLRDTSAIMEFLNVLITSAIGEEEKMVVQCFDGSRVCGVFCSLMNIISRLRLDKEVDIFLTIRELQTVRPQFVPSFEQYKLCHDMVKEYIRSSNVYANM